jgi:hypothetical protein
MVSVRASLDGGVSTEGLDAALEGQLSALTRAVQIAIDLAQSPPGEIGEFAARMSALRGPGFSVEGDVLTALNAAGGAMPGDPAAILAPALDVLARFDEAVSESLTPLLLDVTASASAVQQLLSVRLGCPPEAEAGDEPPPPPEPPPGDPPADPPPDSPPGEPAAPESARRLDAATAQVASVNGMLSGLPTPLDPLGLLQLLLMLLGYKPRDAFFQINLPVVDDLIDPLQTLAVMPLLTPDALAAQFAGNVDLFRTQLEDVAAGPVQSLATDLAALQPDIDASALAAAVDALIDGYQALAAALEADDLVAADAVAATLGTALDTFDSLRAGLTANVLPGLALLNPRLGTLPVECLDRLDHLLNLMESSHLVGHLASLTDPVTPVSDAAVQAVQAALDPALTFVDDLLELLDISAIESQVSDVADTLRAISNELQGSVTQVAAAAQAAASTVVDTLQGVGLDALEQQLLAQIEAFGDDVEAELIAAFSPARDALGELVTGLDEAVTAFDPQQLVGELGTMLDDIAAVLNGPEIAEAIGEVKRTVDAVAGAVEQLSFTPVTDEVVRLIEQMRDALRSALEEDINDAAKAAINTALSALPDDLQPVTDPLVEDFERLVDEGPLSLIEQVKDVPGELLSELERYQPSALIGEQLAGPYDELLGRLDGLQLRSLLDPAAGAFDDAKRELLRAAAPSQALEALRAPHEQLVAQLTALSGASLIGPVNDAITRSIDRVIDASPLDEAFAAVNDAFAAIRAILDLADALRELTTHVEALVASFEDSDAQIDAWRDTLLDAAVSAAGGTLDAALANLDVALDASAHDSVATAIDSATQPVLDALATLDPATRLSRLVQPYGRCSRRVAALPDSATRSALQALLGRFDPLAATDAAPLRELEGTRLALLQLREDFAGLTTDWNDGKAELEVLRTGGSLSPAALRTRLSAQVEPALSPLRTVFNFVESVQPAVSAALAVSEQLVTDLTGRADALLTGPDSLEAIAQTLQALVDELRDFDLSFLTEALDEVADAATESLRALDPAALGVALDEAFADRLDRLDFDLLLPTPALDALNDSLAGVREGLAAADPDAIVVAAVQPVYEQTVLPLLEALDLTPVFTALIEYLNGLDDELKAELGRVNAAYQSFINTRAGSSGGSVSVGL